MSEMSDNQELMDVFYQEAQDLIEKMKTDLASLSKEKKPENLNRLYRCAHTLKGSAGVVDFDKLQSVAQALAKIFKVAKDGKLEIDADIISLLSDSVEVCQKLLNEEEVTNYKELLKQLNNIG